jgi:long chain fatty acid CoA FadD26
LSTVVSTIPAALAELVRQNPDEAAYTYIDYEVDPAGYAETVSWAQVQHRAQVIAHELASCGSPGDRIAIMAPQGLEYILGFLGAIAGGFIAVPLPVPVLGRQDERASAALKDSAPVAVLTTSAVVDNVVSCAGALPGPPPAVIEMDALDLDAPVDFRPMSATKTALLQYTSGSTRIPAAVVVSHKNVLANIKQVLADYFQDDGAVTPPGTTLVSWLPFYHDMGLLLGIMGAITLHCPAVVMSPVAFLQKPARWMQQLASHPHTFTASPNFAFELAARRTSDDDMAGFDLAGVHTILSGSERIHATTIRRFSERFARFNLPANAVAPSYGLAEAMVYAGSAPRSHRPVMVRFDYEKLAAGYASQSDTGSELVSIGAPRAITTRIVDLETRTENPAGKVGEVWLHGDNVSAGYWRKPQQTERTFGARIVNPSPGTPAGSWLRTGDLGVMIGGEFYIVGRIKDLLIIDGRNHYPDDIESTIQEISGGRAVAISVPKNQSEQLVVIVEHKQKGDSDAEIQDRMHTVKRDVTAAISKLHAVRVGDFVLVAPGSIPITTSGKVRRSSCIEAYQQDGFTRLDAMAPLDEVDALN